MSSAPEPHATVDSQPLSSCRARGREHGPNHCGAVLHDLVRGRGCPIRADELRFDGMAEAAVTGLLQGTTITLDAPVPPLDGQRVHVVISSADETSTLSREDQVRLWDEWARKGPQGPIEDDEAPEFP